MFRKQLENGKWVEKVNHLEQSPEENMTDMIAGFFDSNDLSFSEKMQIYTECFKVGDYTIGLVKLAERILEDLGDQEFAIEVYRKAQRVVSDIDDYYSLIVSIVENLIDLEWGGILVEEAILLAERKHDTSSYVILAEIIIQCLHDSDRSKFFYEKAFQYRKTAEDLEFLFNSAIEQGIEKEFFQNMIASPVALFLNIDLN